VTALDRDATVARIRGGGVVAVVRLPTADGLVDVAAALAAGGVPAVEFTMTTPGALAAIEAAASRLGDDVVLGAGTVLDAATARMAARAGARFVVGPVLSRDVIEAAHEAGAAAIPGAFTPTEIHAAANWGADLVKVFPATGLGPRYLRDLLAPLPDLRLMPSGGVDLANAGAYIEAGAAAISVGSSLVDRVTVANGDMAELTRRAAAFRAAVEEARAGAMSRHRTIDGRPGQEVHA